MRRRKYALYLLFHRQLMRCMRLGFRSLQSWDLIDAIIPSAAEVHKVASLLVGTIE